MRSILILFALLLLTGASAPSGCDTAGKGSNPELGVFGNACTPGLAFTVDLPSSAAYVLSVQAVTASDGVDTMAPISWTATADSLTTTCPDGASSFIVLYATTEAL